MKKFIACLIMLAIVSPFVAFAQTNPCAVGTDGTASLGKCVSGIYMWSMGAAALLALLMLVYGGYQVMTAGGNGQQATNGKSYITSSLVGIALLLSAYLILNTINPDLVDFQITGFDQTAPPTP